MDTFWTTCRKLYSKYGPIVRIPKMTPKLNLVYIFSPDDLQKLFKVEGPSPVRPPIDILQYYRQKRPQWYTSPGLVTGNGEEWRSLRSAIAPLMKRNVVADYKRGQSQVANDLIRYIRMVSETAVQTTENRKVIYIEDMLPVLFRYTLEAVGLVSLGHRIGCLNQESDPHSSFAQSLISANETSLDVMGQSILSPSWHRIWHTRNYRKLVQAQDTIAKAVLESLPDTLFSAAPFASPTAFASSSPTSLPQILLQETPHLSRKDLFLLIVEILQGGIDATATTLLFCLYYLAKNTVVQNELYNEVSSVETVKHNLQGLPFLRGVLRETLRLRSSASAVGRIVQKELELGGYWVPKETLVIAPQVISCEDHNNFPDPLTFNPQRWRSDKLKLEHKSHPFSTLPFGHGARMCPGRRLAEQEIYLALIKTLQCYHIELSDGHKTAVEVGQIQRLNMIPDGPIGLKFINRNHI